METNFREKVNGDGVQPLFKSNILNYGGSKDQETRKESKIQISGN